MAPQEDNRRMKSVEVDKSQEIHESDDISDGEDESEYRLSPESDLNHDESSDLSEDTFNKPDAHKRKYSTLGMEDEAADDPDFLFVRPDEHKGDVNFKEPAGLKKVSGKSFQHMQLSEPILKAVLRKGYRMPSPIQRASIPRILAGRDVIGMARTGSGKTAAFIIPMLQKLKAHSIKVGVRAVILSPTRELAIQTFKFVKELSALTDLRSCLVIGGDNLEDLFTAITGNPDIIVATPGRLVHLSFEMSLKFDNVEYVVFDEADRLLEMGFAVQLNEFLSMLPEARQTLLFSATIPESLVEFAKIGLKDPDLVRLDIDFRISRDLEPHFIFTMDETRDACLTTIIGNLVDKNGLSLVFVPTKHHAEYVNLLLNKMNFCSTCIYGDMDNSLRTSRVNMFRSGKIKILIVTDLAARGVDIPLLDNVINYTFPSSCKLFVHRVGRVGRAGRKGVAYSLVSQSELPYVIDLQMFTGRPLKICSKDPASNDECYDYLSDIVCGAANMEHLALETEKINKLVRSDESLSSARKVTINANKKYLKSILPPSRESIARAHQILPTEVGVHPLFKNIGGSDPDSSRIRSSLLEQISRFRPSETIFEFMSNDRSMREGAACVKRRKKELCKILEKHRGESRVQKGVGLVARSSAVNLETGSSTKQPGYISYTPENFSVEKGLKVTSVAPFLETSKEAILNIASDNLTNSKYGISQKPKRVWDSKKHRFKTIEVGADNKKLIRSESGALIPVSFKSNRFEDWKKKTRLRLQSLGDVELESISRIGVSKMEDLSKRRKGLPRYKPENSGKTKSKVDTPLRDEIKPTQKLVKEKLQKLVRKQKTLQKAKTRNKHSSQKVVHRKLPNKRGGRNKPSGNKRSGLKKKIRN